MTHRRTKEKQNNDRHKLLTPIIVRIVTNNNSTVLAYETLSYVNRGLFRKNMVIVTL